MAVTPGGSGVSARHPRLLCDRMPGGTVPIALTRWHPRKHHFSTQINGYHSRRQPLPLPTWGSRANPLCVFPACNLSLSALGQELSSTSVSVALAHSCLPKLPEANFVYALASEFGDHLCCHFPWDRIPRQKEMSSSRGRWIGM